MDLDYFVGANGIATLLSQIDGGPRQVPGFGKPEVGDVAGWAELFESTAHTAL